MNRSYQRLFCQRQHLRYEERTQREQSEHEQQWSTQQNMTSRVDLWWNDDVGVDATVQANTHWSMSYVPTVTRNSGRQMTNMYGSMMDTHRHDGRRWTNMSDAIKTTGSWKTRELRKTCKEASTTANDATANYETANGEAGDVQRATAGKVEVGVGVVREPNGPLVRQDVLHDGGRDLGRRRARRTNSVPNFTGGAQPEGVLD
ncbi:unnamed protein product [Phytophthora fragariaefolia]|uniref:Unnamed protein product n=1 Tax=Phytophthora fragariaefolia TaxID=1490495 RepID=A0A9W6Y3S3_9STRA|nr:unnamed protein product [Phytophthora fragariaefolia]